MNLIKCYTYENYFAFQDKFVEIPKQIFNNTIIYDKDEFIKLFQKKYNKKMLWLKSLHLIVDDSLSINDVDVLKSVIKEIFRDVTIIKDSTLLRLSKSVSYLIKGNKLKLYYIDYHNLKHRIIIDENYTLNEINLIIEKRYNKSLIIVNTDYSNEKINYYYDKFANIFDC